MDKRINIYTLVFPHTLVLTEDSDLVPVNVTEAYTGHVAVYFTPHNYAIISHNYVLYVP